jgi:hypothetical protein
MNREEYIFGLLVKKRGSDDTVGELGFLENIFLDTFYLPYGEWRYSVKVCWWTGPHENSATEEEFEYLDILSPEEEAMYRLAELGGG